ncbi:MAG: ATP-binding protein [Bradymonadia bacterium]
MSAEGALEQLVHQFSDPLSFYRELIQNALDAGSPSIDIWFEFEPAKGSKKKSAPGVMIIHVDDAGEGMDREIIDTRLTRLFSSAKDGDFTKIGRFGIGFVSVFAVEPEAVCVDTSRGGEHWRVLFEKDRSFTRIARDEPVDGTLIRIYKPIDAEGYADFVRRSEETVRFWCKHVEQAEIIFEGEMINGPVDLDLPVIVRHEVEGTQLIAGYAEDGSSHYGFYNKGLTLLEGSDDTFFPGVHFKISSRYLEHTLTRDNVLRDKHFHQAMALLKTQIEESLPLAAFRGITEEGGELSREALYHILQVQLANGEPPKAALGLPIARRAGSEYEGPDSTDIDAKGTWLTLARCQQAKAKGRLFSAPLAHSPIIALAESEEGVTVIEDTPVVIECLNALGGPAIEPLSDRWCAPVPLGEQPEGWPALKEAVVALLDRHGARTSEVYLGRFDTPGSGIADRVAITQKTPWGLTPLQEIQVVSTSFFSRKRALIINGGHDAVTPLLRLAAREPALAAYFLVKQFFLGASLDPELDVALAEAAAAGV